MLSTKDLETLLVFPGHEQIPGLCHLRRYRPPARRPICIVGELQDNPGASPTVVIERVAQTIWETVNDHQPFQLITHHVDPHPTFLHVEFTDHTTAPTSSRSTLIVGADEVAHVGGAVLPPTRFTEPRWTLIPHIHSFIGERVETWEREEYTTLHLFGAVGFQTRNQVAQEARDRTQDFRARIAEFRSDNQT